MQSKSKTKCFCYLRNAFSKFWQIHFKKRLIRNAAMKSHKSRELVLERSSLEKKKNVHLKYLAKIANTPFFKAKGCVRRKPNVREKSKMEKRKE